MSGKIKSKVVLLFSECTPLGLSFVNILLQEKAQEILIVDKNIEDFKTNDLISKNPSITLFTGDSTKIDDIEGIYKTKKKIDIVINSKEIIKSETWENEITKHINSMICSTLLAMKHLGKINSGKGGMVVNSLMVFKEDKSSEDTAYMGISRLLDDLDRSFGDPYYYNSTAVRILTMCARMEIGKDAKEDPEGATSGSSLTSLWDAHGLTLLKIIEDKKSNVDLMFLDKSGGNDKSIEQFEIVTEN